MSAKSAGRPSQQDRRQMMLTQPVGSVIVKMSLPAIVSFLITSIYNLADTFFVSSLGTNATAAVSVNASIDQLIMMTGSLLAIGAGSYISRLLGAGKDQKASNVLSTAFFIAVALGGLLAVCGLSFLRPLVRFLGATSTCEQYSVDYATYVLLAAPLMSASFVMNQCLRSEGSAVLSMIGMGFGGILNCILDPIFIFHFGLGVAGATMATAISKLVSFLILINPYLTGRSMLKLSVKNFRPEADVIVEILSVGSSSFLRNGLAVVAAILLNKEAGAISDSVLAGIGVTTKIMMFPFGIVLGLGTGFQPVAGFNWGAGRFDRVRESYKAASLMALATGLVMGVLLFFSADAIIDLFAGTDANMHAIGRFSIRLQSIALPIHAWVGIVNMFCAGLGYAGEAVLLATARQGSCFLPILYPLSRIFGARGVASVQAAADVLTLLLAVPVILKLLRIIRQKEQEQRSLQASVS